PQRANSSSKQMAFTTKLLPTFSTESAECGRRSFGREGLQLTSGKLVNTGRKSIVFIRLAR
ncbi:MULTISPECIES: hypothetical protein, partial [unclassified Bradyrhizobium]|uniref:hypothetical protein n=1 Tax=unclassified Bradyrhizobium TaxID=2631580 RepID=UPI0028E27C98